MTSDPMAALIAAVDDTVTVWGWVGLFLVPVGVAVVMVRRLGAVAVDFPPPPVREVDQMWREDGLALWREFEEGRRG